MLSGTSNNQEKKQPLEQIDLSEQQLGSPSIQVSVKSQSEKLLKLSSALDVSTEVQVLGMDDQFYKNSKLSEAFETSESSELIEHDAKDGSESKVVKASSPTHSTSILDKLFGSALTLNGVVSSGFIEVIGFS